MHIRRNLTDDDLRYQYRIMQRWCRLFHKTAADWVNLKAKHFRKRHPVPISEASKRR